MSNYTLLSGTEGAATSLLLAIPICFVAGLARGATKRSIDYNAQVL